MLLAPNKLAIASKVLQWRFMVLAKSAQSSYQYARRHSGNPKGIVQNLLGNKPDLGDSGFRQNDSGGISQRLSLNSALTRFT